MKVLITGANSYIGENVRENLTNHGLVVDVIDMLSNQWKLANFCNYDAIFHVAAIVHDYKKKKDKSLYHQVNCELAFEVAKKAKESGVRQFVFMSTTDVYPDKSFIDLKTAPKPRNLYGKSKLDAEKKILTLEENNFAVSIVRPPLVYGKNCRGNFNKLEKFAEKTIFFPKYLNRRSMIYIGNLAEFIRLIIERSERGIFLPQDKDYHSTYTMIRTIAEGAGRKVIYCSFFNFIVFLFSKVFPSFRKVFSNSMIDKTTIPLSGEYIIFDNDEAIKKSV